jgi:hypothetical protein
MSDTDHGTDPTGQHAASDAAGTHDATAGHGDGHGHDDHGHGGDTLGPFDWKMWGIGILGVIVAGIVTAGFVAATSFSFTA